MRKCAMVQGHRVQGLRVALLDSQQGSRALGPTMMKKSILPAPAMGQEVAAFPAEARMRAQPG